MDAESLTEKVILEQHRMAYVDIPGRMLQAGGERAKALRWMPGPCVAYGFVFRLCLVFH